MSNSKGSPKEISEVVPDYELELTETSFTFGEPGRV